MQFPRKRVINGLGEFLKRLTTRLRFWMLRKYKPDAQARVDFRGFPAPSLARRACICVILHVAPVAPIRILAFPIEREEVAGRKT